MKAATLRIASIRPASGQALVRVALCNGLCIPQPQAQANLWDCAYEDRVSPGGGSA
ncbi:hypothetical protein M2282_003585 [Variovorax boronicumulans]|uniref:hypothetical protein n=1 Tax=Variovorax boronicumulans TaxID=436515 RepID=UPI002475AADC|nr:hypothetical protein [Variovorax boronicumulans]MDH6168432.1 hypothetical protein [Variovorax boronicumulans]